MPRQYYSQTHGLAGVMRPDLGFAVTELPGFVRPFAGEADTAIRSPPRTAALHPDLVRPRPDLSQQYT